MGDRYQSQLRKNPSNLGVGPNESNLHEGFESQVKFEGDQISAVFEHELSEEGFRERRRGQEPRLKK